MNCPRCDAPAATDVLQQFGGVCPKCVLDFAAENDAPSFPNLEILSLIGEGGMGAVYKARQKHLDRVVALKTLSPQLSGDPEFVTRFEREAKALASLNHPNIVSIHDYGVHDGVPYLVMEFVEGTSLRKLLAQRKLAPERAMEIVPQICDALHYAHSRGVVHRDVKPENILIDREGRVKIADFGLAKLAAGDRTRMTRSNAVMGTPHYMAPEQTENPAAVDHRADIYSLGVVFYEMLTGELPIGRFKAPSERAPVDSRLDPVVLKSLEKEPDQRWQSAGEVRERVTNLGTAPVPAEEEGYNRWATAFWTGFPAWVCFLTAGALALGGSYGGAFWTAFGGAICVLPAIGVLLSGQAPRRTAPVVPPAGPRRDPLVYISSLCLVVGVVALATVFTLSPGKQAKAENNLILAGSGLLILSLALSVISYVRIVKGRGRWTGRAWALGQALVALAVLLIIVALGAVPAEPVWRNPKSDPAVFVSPPVKSRTLESMPPYSLSDVWHGLARLPEGLSFGQRSEGREALSAAGFPERMFDDVAEARYARFDPGSLELVGLRFRTRVQQELWWASPELRDRWPKKTVHRGVLVLLLRPGSFGPASSTPEQVWNLVREKLR